LEVKEMIITVKNKNSKTGYDEHQVDKDKVNDFIDNLKKGTEFSIREVRPEQTYERTYIK